MKRALKIILILIFIAAIVLVVLWLIARHRAAQTGTTEPTFKDFFSRTPSATQVQNPTPGESSSDFTNGSGDQSGENGTGNGAGGEGAGGTINGSFTNGTISPTQPIGTGYGSGSGSGSGNGTDTGGSGSIPGSTGGSGSGSDQTGGVITTGSGGTSTTGNTNFPPSSPSSALPSLAACSEADTHIEFNTDELAELDTLSKQFYTLAQTLHSDADVSSAQAAFDSFNIQDQQLTELISYAQAHPVADAQLARKVETPFWNDNTMVPTFFPGDATNIATAHCGGDHCDVLTYYNTTDEANNEANPPIANTSTLLERFLRVSLW